MRNSSWGELPGEKAGLQCSISRIQSRLGFGILILSIVTVCWQYKFWKAGLSCREQRLPWLEEIVIPVLIRHKTPISINCIQVQSSRKTFVELGLYLTARHNTKWTKFRRDATMTFLVFKVDIFAGQAGRSCQSVTVLRVRERDRQLRHLSPRVVFHEGPAQGGESDGQPHCPTHQPNISGYFKRFTSLVKHCPLTP